MKQLLLILLLALSLNSIAAEDITAHNCEIFIDKVVPVKVYFHDTNCTYSKLEIYLKIKSLPVDRIKKVVFFAKSNLLHAYGSTSMGVNYYQLEKHSDDYYKLSIEVNAKNHSVSKYGNSRTHFGNFYVELDDGTKIWTDLRKNIFLNNQVFEWIPINTKWLNDGMYNIDSIPQVKDFEGKMSIFNPQGCY